MTAGLYTITVQEAQGYSATTADIAHLAVVAGCASSYSGGPSPAFLSAASAHATLGYGDAVDVLCQIVEQVQPSGQQSAKLPAYFYDMPSTTAGTIGTKDVTLVTGTASTHVAFAGTSAAPPVAAGPFGTYSIWVKAIGAITLGTSGAIQWSADGGINWSSTVNIGTALSYTIPGLGVTVTLGQSAETWVDGDIAKCPTTGPMPAGADIDAMFTALAQSNVPFSIVVIETNMTAALAAKVKTGLDTLLATGKRAIALCRYRVPNSGESDATWNAAYQTEFRGATPFYDSRVFIRASYQLITDASTGRQYLRSDLAQFAADVCRTDIDVAVGSPADRPGGVPNLTLVNSSGALIGHDEGPRGASSGLSTDTIQAGCIQRIAGAQAPEAIYYCVPWSCASPTDRIKNIWTRRIADRIEADALALGLPALGNPNMSYIPADPGTPGSQTVLTPIAIKMLHSMIYPSLAAKYAKYIDNARDSDLETGLVQINPVVTVSGGNLVGATLTVAPKVKGVLLSLGITLAMQQ